MKKANKKSRKAGIAPNTIVYALLALALLLLFLLMLPPVRDKMFLVWDKIANAIRFG